MLKIWYSQGTRGRNKLSVASLASLSISSKYSSLSKTQINHSFPSNNRQSATPRPMWVDLRRRSSAAPRNAGAGRTQRLLGMIIIKEFRKRTRRLLGMVGPQVDCHLLKELLFRKTFYRGISRRKFNFRG
jgi:hypothetical protein